MTEPRGYFADQFEVGLPLIQVHLDSNSRSEPKQL